MRWLSLVLTGCALVSRTWCRSAFGSRILVVLDREEDSFSKLWTELSNRGFQVTFRKAKSEPLLIEFGEPVYDHLIVFAPAAKNLAADLSPQSLYQFLTYSSISPRNILFALNETCAETWKDFAREFSIEFDSKNTQLIDHFKAVDGSTFHSVINVQPKPFQAVTGSRQILSQSTLEGSPVVYSGLVHSVAANFPLAIPILTAPSTAYSYDIPSSPATAPILETELDGSAGSTLFGQQANLVSGVQLTNGARVVWSGSIDLFLDEHAASNAPFVRDVTSWLFQESGVLRVDSVTNSKIGSVGAPKEYRIGNEMVYTIALSQFLQDAWRPVALTSLQLEVTMLDPHLRVPLHPASLPSAAVDSTSRQTSSLYTATMRLPDRHGVFTLYTDFKRQGWTFIEQKDMITITPLRHDEHRRFIGGAWPYYLGAISTSMAFLVFAGLFLSTNAVMNSAPSLKGKEKAL